jgi:hypothetical protein
MTGSLPINGSVTGNVQFAGEHDRFSVDLTAGTPYRFDLRGADTGSGTLTDPWLKLYDAAGTILAADDDGASVYDALTGHSTNSQIVFIPWESGVYYVEANGFDQAVGTYTLTSQTLNDDYYYQSVLDNPLVRWNGGQSLGTPVTVTYSFPETMPSDFAEGHEVGFKPFSEAQKAATRQVLQDISSFSHISFLETAGDTGSIRFGTTNQTNSGGVTYANDTDGLLTRTDIALDNSNTSNANVAVGTYGYFTLIHEIGHALGLKHPGDYNAGGGGAPPPYLPSSQDAIIYTVESYNSTTDYLDLSPSAYQLAKTMMAFDIAAVQYLYGTNSGTRTGNDTYGFDAGTIYTIWDGGGTDTLDVSSWTAGVTLNLNPGTVSYSGLVGTDTLGANLRPRVAIAFDCVIENATGTAFADLILGNAAANSLQGGAGNDRIEGGGGDDLLAGGAGNDTLLGAAGTDTAIYTGARAQYLLSATELGWQISGPEGTDTLDGIEYARFSDQFLWLNNQSPTGSVTVTGSAIEDQTLTASNSLADADGLGAIAYQWQSSANGITWTNIAGSTAGTLVLGDSEVGKQIRVVASYIDGHGTTESMTSTGTSAVANVNDAPTGSVTIAGAATEDQTLTVSNTLADADGLGAIAYQWQSSSDGSTWTNIAGSVGNTLALGDAQVGKQIHVQASYTDGHGTSESVNSPSTSAVANVNDVPTGTVTLSGTATEDQTLTASNTLADADGLGTIAYQWQSSVNGITWTNIAAATNSALALGDALVGQQIRVHASYTDGHGTSESVNSPGTSAVANVNDVPTGTVTLSGTATEDQTLTASNTLADADGIGTIAYQWQSSSDGSTWTNIAGSTASTLSLGDAQVGRQVRVVASYTDGHGTQETIGSPGTSAVANINDAPTGGVSVTGTAAQGQLLSANTSTLADADGLGALSYQWLRAGAVIGGATSNTYSLTQADVGSVIGVKVNYTDGFGTAESVTSSAISLVANVNDAPAGGVTITGTATQGQVLTANTTTLDDADGLGALSYQWLQGNAVIAAATANTYHLTQSDVGKSVSVRVSYTDGYGAAESVSSVATAPVANVNDAPTGEVSVGGTATQGQLLSANISTLADADGLGSLGYQWLRAGAVITGATGSIYTLTQSDVGNAINVRVNYADGGGTVESVSSAVTAAVANINDAPTGSVSITGTAAQGQMLTASTSTLADEDGLGTLVYQWLRAGAVIGGAKNNTYSLTQADVGSEISVKVNYTDAFGTAESVTSSATGAVANVNDALTGVVSITGTPAQGQVLAANTSTLADVDGLGALSYQWLHAGAAIAGATASTYTLAQNDVGLVVSVRVNYTDGGGTAESVSSAATAAVAHNSGVNPALEALVPPPLATGLIGDGNGDGILDTIQSNVTSTSVTQHGTANQTYLTLIADSLRGLTDTTDNNSASISNFQTLATPAGKPGVLTLPTDLIQFNANLDHVGGTETFSLFVDSSIAVDGFWHQNNTGMWVNLATAVETVGGKTRVDFAITDGGPYDADGVANGVIVALGGEGFMPLSILGAVPDNPAHSFWI